MVLGRVDLGKDAKVYRNTGTWAAPVWSEVSVLSNVSNNVEKNQATYQRRSDDWIKTRGTGKDATVEIELPHASSDANIRALRRSLLADEPVELLIMSKTRTTAGAEGLRATFECVTKNRAEPIDGILMDSFTLKVTDNSGDNDPQWYVCATKNTGSGTAIADDTAVYWDSVNSYVTTTAGSNEFLGYSVGASIDGDSVMYYDADRANPA